MVDIPNPVQFTCAATADPSIGGACKFTQGLCPVDGCSAVENGDRTVAALGQVRVFDGGPDGLDVFRKVAAGAPDWLAPGGVLLSEITDGPPGT